MENIIKESVLRNIIKDVIKESLLNEAKNLVDNFNDIAAEIDADAKALNDPDKFWYIEVKKRFKDNPGLHSKVRGNPTINSDGYGVYLGSFRVSNGQELLKLKPQIVALCEKNNARSYITINPRSYSAIQKHIQSPHFKSYLRKGVSPLANPEDVSAGRAVKFFDGNGRRLTRQEVIDNYGSDRPKFMFDIDEKDPNVWKLTRIILQHFNIQIVKERKTPSGGLHIICADAFDPKLPEALEMLRIYDCKVHNGKKIYFPTPRTEQERRMQVVGCDYDGKEILYSNVDTRGY